MNRIHKYRYSEKMFAHLSA